MTGTDVGAVEEAKGDAEEQTREESSAPVEQEGQAQERKKETQESASTEIAEKDSAEAEKKTELKKNEKKGKKVKKKTKTKKTKSTSSKGKGVAAQEFPKQVKLADLPSAETLMERGAEAARESEAFPLSAEDMKNMPSEQVSEERPSLGVRLRKETSKVARCTHALFLPHPMVIY